MNLKTNFKNNFNLIHALCIALVLLLICGILGVLLYTNNKQYKTAMENNYNMAFFELVDYVEKVQNYLAKSLISNSKEQGADTLTRVWKEANLAQIYLGQIPVSNEHLANTSRFLNQVSDYSYSLSRKNINNQDLSQEDLDNLKELYTYSISLKNTLYELSENILTRKFKME